MDSLWCRVDRCDTGETTADSVTSLLDDTVTVGSGACDAVTGWPVLPTSAELATLATLTVTADVRLRRSNIRDDMVDELDTLTTAGRECNDRLGSFVFTLCFARRRSNVSSGKHRPEHSLTSISSLYILISQFIDSAN